MRDQGNVLILETTVLETTAVGRVVFSNPESDVVFTLDAGQQAKDEGREVEQAFCLSEQRLGTLRAG